MVSGNKSEEEKQYARAETTAIIGSAMIFFVNEFLSAQGITVQVGLNPWTVLTTGILGTPGVALLYGISFYGIM